MNRDLRISLTIALGLLLVSVNTAAMPFLLPSITASVGSDITMAGYLVLGVLAGGLFLFFGRLGDTIGPFPVFIWGNLIIAAGYASVFLLDSSAGYLLGCTILGIGISAVAGVANGIIRSTSREESLARSFSVLFIGIGFGFLIGPPLAGFLSVSYEWYDFFRLLALLHLVLAVASWKILPGERYPLDWEELDINGTCLLLSTLFGCITAYEGFFTYHLLFAGYLGLLTAGVSGLLLVIHEKRARFRIIDPEFFRIRGVIPLLLLSMVVILVYRGLVFIIQAYMGDIRSYSLESVGMFTILPAAVALLVIPVVGWTGDRYGESGRIWLCGTGCIIAIIASTLVYTLTDGDITALVILILAGCYNAVFRTPLYASYFKKIPACHSCYASGVIETGTMLITPIVLPLVGLFFQKGIFLVHADWQRICWLRLYDSSSGGYQGVSAGLILLCILQISLLLTIRRISRRGCR